MYHKYFVDKKDAGWDTLGELGLLALSALGTYLSLKGIKGVVDEWRIKGGEKTYYNVDGSPIWPPNRDFDGEPVTIYGKTGFDNLQGVFNKDIFEFLNRRNHGTED